MGVAEIVAVVAVLVIGVTALFGRTVRRDQRAGLIVVPAATAPPPAAPEPPRGDPEDAQ